MEYNIKGVYGSELLELTKVGTKLFWVTTNILHLRLPVGIRFTIKLLPVLVDIDNLMRTVRVHLVSFLLLLRPISCFILPLEVVCWVIY